MATEGPFPWCAPLHVGGCRQVATEDPTPWGAASGSDEEEEDFTNDLALRLVFINIF